MFVNKSYRVIQVTIDSRRSCCCVMVVVAAKTATALSQHYLPATKYPGIANARSSRVILKVATFN